MFQNYISLISRQTALGRKTFFFIVAGLVGFSIEGAAVYFASGDASNTLISVRFISFPIAIIVTWYINRQFGFRVSSPVTIVEFCSYLKANILAQFLNFTIYILLVLQVSFFTERPVFALVIATSVSMVFSFLNYLFVVFIKD
jgi:putative flippase GtrA